ncbi:dynamin family protein [Nocardia sp. 2]|uniref:Dynamin family protein n=1 Tax=Nocardia acididurans TaxID=2802282 RepID=A0ABS1LYT3_9NOCA|nr:dynamin family protein [Nocardia acididurans]MBL1072930.1 dynamin family protein [Nocardia acididurans]
MRYDSAGYGLVPETRGLVAAARRAFEGRPRVRAQLDECARRLDQPLRVALAGQLKAGKSTLLNALVGQDIAPTDATECTRLVTWYRNGAAPRVTAYSGDGARADVVVRRGRGADGLPGAHGLTFDLSGLRWNSGAPREVDRLEVEWPSAELAQTTIIDTPGISSLSRDVSARTSRLLTPQGGDAALPSADAVVYLLRRLDAADVDFLERIGSGADRSGADATRPNPAGPLGVIGVVSRADEIGAGRIDALHSARDVAARFSGELERTGLCQSVIPVAGLLAFAAATLRQREYAAFEALATVPVDELSAALLSADRFARPDLPLPVPPELRAHLAGRFGLFGIRLAVTLIRLGVRDADSLARELTQRSGLDELRTVLDVQFAQRADELKAHSALTALARILATNPGTSADTLLPRVRTLLADVHSFAELRLLGHLRSDELPLPTTDLNELHRLIGGAGVATHLRLGLSAHTDIATQREEALAAVHKWRSRARHPLADQSTANACLTAARSAEGLLEILHAPPTTPFARISLPRTGNTQS